MNLHIDNNRIEITTDKQIIVNGQEVKPAWDRQTVLRGEWKPKPYSGEHYSRIEPDGSFIKNCKATEFSNHDGYICFPNYDLLSEFLTIGKGEWLPKKGDEFYEISMPRANLLPKAVAQYDYAPSKFGHFFFPSEAQRTAYLATLKPEVTVEKLNEEWEKVWEEVSEYANDSPVLYHATNRKRNLVIYLYACIKSAWAADKIRASEGPGDGRKYCVLRMGVVSLATQEQSGVEYFNTEKGCETYALFMKDELQYL